MTDADEIQALRRKLGETLETVTTLEAELAAARRAHLSAVPSGQQELAEAIYDAWAHQAPGLDLPRWKDMQEDQHRRWHAAAEAARIFVLSDTHD